jgi:hypothetical protein
MAIVLHAELSSHSRHGLRLVPTRAITAAWRPKFFRRLFRKLPVRSIKQKQQGESETVCAILRDDERLVSRSQRPRVGDGTVIKLHFSESVRDDCRKS